MHTETMAPVVVGVDGTAENLCGAVELAAEEAAARLTPLLIVYAHRRLVAQRLAGERELLTVALAQALCAHPGLAVSARLALGEPARTLVAQSREAGLVVVGHHAGRPGPSTPEGSLAAALAAGSECPVIVYRPINVDRDFGQPRPVLVGVDGGAASSAAVEFAFEEAALRGAELHAMHVWSGPVGAPPDALARAFAVLAEALTGWSEKYPEVHVCRAARFGPDVARTLGRASRRAQLVVVGARRPHRLIRDIGARLIDQAGCPVAVVPLDRF